MPFSNRFAPCFFVAGFVVTVIVLTPGVWVNVGRFMDLTRTERPELVEDVFSRQLKN